MKLQLAFGEPGYIAHPYWPEMYRVIEIEKKSGVNRVRSESRRRQALESYLNEMKMTLADFEALKVLAARPFHTNGSDEIIIPGDKVLSCLVNAELAGPSKLRLGNIRASLRASHFDTGKAAPDGTWERFAKLEESNQRGFRSSPYIRHFKALGTIDHDAKMVEPKALLALLEFAGREIGIGASRKMGWGRFTVQEIA